MGQNVSTAVMQRRAEAHDSLDDFPTPPWATRALVEHVIGPAYGDGTVDKRSHEPKSQVCFETVWEPACNRGHMVKPLREYFLQVYGSDVHSYGFGQQADFLIPDQTPWERKGRKIDWIITNPPFRLAQQFLDRAFSLKPRGGVAIIVRSAFLEGVGRYHDLFSTNPPSIIAQFTERVVMVKGRLEPNGSSATAYSWLVWQAGATGTQMVWIPPCRKQLERASDYPVEVAA